MSSDNSASIAKRSQSAMEFLMTYGWAILILAVVIGALVELGAFGSVNASPNSCIAVSGYVCSDPLLYSSGVMLVNFGQIGTGAITITGTACGTSSTVSGITPTTEMVVEPDQLENLAFQCPLTYTNIGSRFTGHLWIEYTANGEPGIIQELGNVDATVSSGASVDSSTVFVSSWMLVSAINAANNIVVNKISTWPYAGYPGAQISPGGKYIYMWLDWGSQSVFMTENLATDTVVNTLNVVQEASVIPQSFALSPDGQYAYLLGANFITVDLSNYQVVNTITGISAPDRSGFILSHDGKYAYIAENTNPLTLVTINLATDEVTNTLIGPIGPGNTGLAVSPDNNYLYLSGWSFQKLDLSDYKVVDTISLPYWSPHLALSPDGTYAYAGGGGAVYTIDTGTSSITNTLSVFNNLNGIAVSSNGQNLYSSEDDVSGNFVIVNLTDYTVSNVIGGIYYPGAISTYAPS